MLCQNKTLEKLSLQDNGITNEGAQHLFSALEMNTKLVVLNVQKNDINPQADQKLLQLKSSLSLAGRVLLDSPKK